MEERKLLAVVVACGLLVIEGERRIDEETFE